MKVKRYLVGFFFLFWVLYLEPIEIGPLTISQLWKIPFLGYLIVFVLMNKVHHPTYVTVGYLRGFKTVLNGGMLRNPVTEIIEFTRYMMIPLLFDWINLKVKSTEQLDRILIRLACFAILAGIPFLLGILEPLGTEMEHIGGLTSFVGVFQSPHGASTTLAISILIILFGLKNNVYPRHFRFILISSVLLGLLQLYLTYVRTGYLLFFVGILILYLPQRITFKELRPALIVLGSVIIAFVILLQTNEAFYNRIFDIRGRQEVNPGSGRLIFWAASVDMWMQSTWVEKLFGIGMGGLKEGMKGYIGKPLVAHSEVFNLLAGNGIIGLLLFGAYLVALFQFIWAKRTLNSFRLALISFASYLSLMLIQGGVWFPVEVFLALIFVKLYREKA